MLVDDLADQLLQTILQRDEARHRAVLVRHQRQVELLGLHLAHQPVHRLVLGHEANGTEELGDRLAASALSLGTHEILGERKTQHVVIFVRAEHRQSADAMLDRHVERGRDCGGVLDHHHVRTGHHHLASDGVTELDDALDELALLVLHNAVLGRRLDDAQQLLLVDEGTLLEALTLDDDVGERDQATRQRLQQRKSNERPDRSRRELGGAFGVDDRIGLGYRLGQHEEHDDVEHNTDGDACGPEEIVGDDTGERGLHGLGNVDGEQQRVDPPLGLGDQAHQHLAGLAALVGHRHRLVPADPRQAHFGHRQERQQEQQQDHCDQHQHIDAGEFGCDHWSACSCRNCAGAGPRQW